MEGSFKFHSFAYKYPLSAPFFEKMFLSLPPVICIFTLSKINKPYLVIIFWPSHLFHCLVYLFLYYYHFHNRRFSCPFVCELSVYRKTRIIRVLLLCNPPHRPHITFTFTLILTSVSREPLINTDVNP